MGEETTLNILHLSDIHFRKSSEVDNPVFRGNVRDRLIEAVEAHLRDIQTVDMVAVTGDIAFSGTEEQYGEAEIFFHKLKPLLKKNTPILAVQGNHDVNRKKINKSKSLSLHNVVEDKDQEAFLTDENNISFLVTPKLKSFYDFANSLHPDLYPKETDYFWTTNIPGKDRVALLGLNTAWASENEKDKSYITLGYPQVMKALEQTRDADYRILMMHHPPGWLDEADLNRCIDDLYKGCGLILHGHAHMDTAHSVSTPTDTCLLLGADAAFTHDGYIGFQVLRVSFGVGGTRARIWPYRLETKGKVQFVPNYTRWKEAQQGKPYVDLPAPPKETAVTAETAATGELPPLPPIPEAYKEWMKEFHSTIPADLFAKDGEMVRIDLPAVYIPLETDNPFYNPERESMEKGEETVRGGEDTDPHGEPRVMEIEALAERKECLLLRGKAGMGKTTLVKHLAYRLLYPAGPESPGGRLPVPVFLKDLWPIYKKELEKKGETAGFEVLLEAYLERVACPLDMETVEVFCRHSKTLFLLDGLDEAPESLRPGLLEVIRRFAFKRRGNGFLITGRPHGIEGKGMECFGKHLRDIHELSETKSREFIEKWFRAVSGQARGVGRTAAAELIAELKGSERARVFQGNPLLLTALCIFYLAGGKRIPDQRAELYDRVVGNLLYRRFHDPADPGRVSRVREFLMLLAYTMHCRELKDMDVEDALEVLENTFPPGENEKPGKYRERLKGLFKGIEPECGLLNREGGGGIRFAHLSFQEFLAAKHMLDADIDCGDCLGRGWWEESLLLYAGLMNLDMKKRSNRWVSELMDREPRLQVLGARALRDFQAPRRDETVARCVKDKLIALMESKADLNLRIEAGETLGYLGDPRIDPLAPPMVFVEPGPFIMGADDGRDNEKPRREITLEGFWMGKYPVTNQEFAGFIRDRGYENRDYWSEEGWEWKTGEKMMEPRYWQERQWNVPNFPVVGVTWYEARAYLKWLSEKTGGDYRLPSEAQWEKAARGTGGRTYPWGNTFDDHKCNCIYNNLERTTPVGLYPAGQSPYGCMDMAGNVWEWTDSNVDDSKRGLALRGGSWYDVNLDLRCSARLYYRPHHRLNFVGFRPFRPSTKDGS